MYHQSRMWRIGSPVAVRTRFGKAGSPSLMTVTRRPSCQPWASSAAVMACAGCSVPVGASAKRRGGLPVVSTLPTVTSTWRLFRPGTARRCAPSITTTISAGLQRRRRAGAAGIGGVSVSTVSILLETQCSRFRTLV
jgi:hypothetical protein